MRTGVMSRQRLVVAAVAVLVAIGGIVLAVVLGGGDDQETTAGPRVVQPGAPGQPGRTLSAEELASLTAPPFHQADVLFVSLMIPHHAQALEMTALVAGRSAGAEIPLLAERIRVSQTDEIAQMQRWLTDRKLPMPAPHSSHPGHDQLMPGMLNDEQLGELEQARGVAFDRLFLELMIHHHRGAVTMAETLYANGGGVEPESDRFAREVIADQNIEISRMQDLLASLSA